MVPAAGHNPTMYVLNQCLQHIGKQEGMKRTKPMGKKTREGIIKFLHSHICCSNKRTNKTAVSNKRNKNKKNKGNNRGKKRA
jgi:hypothetical protein